MIALTRRSSLLAILAMIAMIAALAALAMAVGVDDADSATYKSCSLSEKEQDPPGDTPTYNLSLKTQKTSCATAKKVAKAFHKCRPKTDYRCATKVLSSWTCSAKKDSSTALLFYATFTCTNASARVKSSYQQNTPSDSASARSRA